MMFVGFEVVEGDAVEIGNDDVAGNVFLAGRVAGEVLDVAEGLGDSAWERSLPAVLCSTMRVPGQKRSM